MPEVGEIKKAREIGRKGNGRHYIWSACEGCGKERWVVLLRGKPKTILCPCCASKKRAERRHLRREENPNWRGGRKKDKKGYIEVLLQLNDFFLPMAMKNG